VQRLGGQLGGLAGADDHDVAGGEVAERVGGGVDGDGGDRGAAGGDRRLGAYALAGGERGAEQLVGHRAGGAGAERELVRALDLALDLRLADDHRLQAAGDPVQVARSVAVAQRVHAAHQLRGPDRGAPGEDPEHVRLGLDGVGDDEVELGAVAGGDRDGLGDRRLPGQLADQRLGAAVEQRELLAQRQRGGLVRRAEGEQLAHRGTASRSVSRFSPRRRSSSASSAISRETRASLVAMIAT
jgi:hypothetical protein